MQHLEDRVPPLPLAWLSGAWVIDKVRTKKQLSDFAVILERLICIHQAKKLEYLHDAALVSASARNHANPECETPQTLPADGALSPEVVCIDRCAHMIGSGIFSRETLALYVYSISLPLTASIPTEEFEGGSATTLMTILTNYSRDCKFQRWNDLYLWCLVKLTLPAWKSTTFVKGETPWSVFSSTFPTGANGIAAPFLNQSATELLMSSSDVQLFVVASCLILELVGTDEPVRINSEILHAQPQPTLTIVTDYSIGPTSVRNAYGYTYENVFYYTRANPYEAISAWLRKCASLKVAESCVDLAVCADSACAPAHNPFRKFCS
jgi:hypothetical protein